MKGGVIMTGYGLIFLLLQEIDRLQKELQELKNQQDNNKE